MTQRRYAADAGPSWRKSWGRPLVLDTAERRRNRVVLFWAVCLNVGGLVAVLVTR